MNLTIDFLDMMNHLHLDTRKQRNKNYICPFCFKKTLQIFTNENKGYCHSPNCTWNGGNPIDLYCAYKNVSFNEAMSELSIALKDKRISVQQYKEQTYQDAKYEFAKDLEFLAWVRIYERFYPYDRRYERKDFEKLADCSKGMLSKILNGQMVNAVTWRKVLNILRNDLEGQIEQLKRDLKLGTQYFEQLIDDDGDLRTAVEKYRIKNPRKRRTKKTDE